MEKTIMSNDNLMSLLQSEIVNVKFKKKNGEIRIMNCTTNPLVLFNYFGVYLTETKSDAESRHPQNLFKAFDTDKKEWRAFLASNVLEINGVFVTINSF